jgi:hypothetical protein
MNTLINAAFIKVTTYPEEKQQKVPLLLPFRPKAVMMTEAVKNSQILKRLIFGPS